MTSAQLIAQACQDAQQPGFTAQAALKLNMILSELCQDYDFDAARKTLNFTLPTATDAFNRASMNFPADYLRACVNDCFYYISGVPYKLISVDLEQFDGLVSQAGVANFPIYFATDMSQSPPLAYFWMAPSGAYNSVLRYQAQMADIVTPATSAVVPWFPNQNYLLTRLTGELCKTADDERQESLLSSDEDRYPGGAGVILRKYLLMKGDPENRTKNVKLDRRVFGSSFNNLRNTKQVGW